MLLVDRGSLSIKTYTFFVQNNHVQSGVIISEVYASPYPTDHLFAQQKSGLLATEWVELQNVSQSVISLDGWMIDDQLGKGSKRTTLSQIIIPPQQRIVLHQKRSWCDVK